MSAKHGALVAFDSREQFYNEFRAGLKYTVEAAIEKDNNYTLYRSEDWRAWATFTGVFVVLVFLDNLVLNRNPRALTMFSATLYTIFWVLCACGFCAWVLFYYGQHEAYMWMSGYMLEWMLSFDNLFVFHVIFNVYGTPGNLKHKPLYLGICGAVFFRLAFIFTGEYLMHAMYFMHIIFGSFLVYTGVKTMTTDDEDEDPSQHPLVKWLQQKVPFVSAYDKDGAFFVRVPVDDRGQALVPELMSSAKAEESSPLLGEDRDDSPSEKRYGTIDFKDVASMAKVNEFGRQARFQYRATMLLLVVFCLELSDMLFAVDSVSAIVAQVPDLFLAYTSAVFAMLGLRAVFFIIDALVQLFEYLKYGVGLVLLFVGVKLMIKRMYHIPPSVVCFVLVSAIVGSMLASVVKDMLYGEKESEDANVENDQASTAAVA
eukprot:TRINITY_DN957_c0_g2_i1.p1 TRINITY_DN957_c0_g2~~TRINITY_DN957_c0_g2_i1.p1  ORF type:complete len:429 (-),score=112.47 TRINITY_DN957_c0_g2_i1:225-1511(-)